MTDYSWTFQNGNFSDPTNWIDLANGDSPAGPPGPSDQAEMLGDLPVDLTTGGSADLLTVSYVALTINGAVLSLGGLSTGGASILTQVTTLNSGSIDSTGVATFGAYSTLVMNGGSFHGHNLVVNYGSLDVTGGTLTAHFLEDFTSATVAAGGVLTGDTLEISGNGGTGVLSVSGTVLGASDLIGVASQTGSVDVTSGGSFDSSGGLTVGSSGTGTITVEGGTLSAEGLGLGIGAGGTGGVALTAGGSLDVTGTLAVGYNDEGNLSLTGSNGSVTGDVDSGDLAGSSGTLEVSGSSDLTVTGDWNIGQGGQHSDTVHNGGSVNVTGNISLGVSSGGAGTLTVADSGSEVSAAALEVGEAGNGTVKLQDGATLSADSADVAIGSGGGTVTLTGSGEDLDVSGALSVGTGGDGLLSVEDGGTVSFGSVMLGGSGTGTLAISGNATDANVSGDISVASGLLTLASAATLAAGAGLFSVGTGGHTAEADLADGKLTVQSATIGASGTVTLEGGTLAASTVTLASGGSISGFGNVGGSETNSGNITAVGGTLALLSGVLGSGLLTIENAGLVVAGSVGVGQTVEFSTNSSIIPQNTLTLDDLSDAAGTIDHFAAGDTILLPNALTLDDRDFGNGVLTLTASGVTMGTLAFLGGYSTGNFLLTSLPSAGGTEITFQPACFAAGTRLETADGDVAVEALRVGDRLRTRDGGLAPVRWIGRRHIDCRRHPKPGDVWPVRIRAGAFGAGVPRRDLYLSPDHAVLVDEALIPIRLLVNGAGIASVPVAEVTYFHVELPLHDVVLAEGLAAESYLDVGDRADFEGGGVLTLHPDFAGRAARAAAVWDASGCAPLVLQGAPLEAARRRLAAEPAEMAA